MATFGDQPAGHHDLALREQALVAYGDGQLWQRTRERWDVLREEIAESATSRHTYASIPACSHYWMQGEPCARPLSCPGRR